MLMLPVLIISLLFLVNFCKSVPSDETTPCTPVSPYKGCIVPYKGNALTHYCTDIVTYYQPKGISQYTLDLGVKSRLSDPKLFLLTHKCQTYAKSLTCGRAFNLPADPYDETFYGSTLPMPFHRVCKSTCIAAATVCPLLASTLNCAGTTDFTGLGPAYAVDSYGPDGSCNNITAPAFKAPDDWVAPQAEKYKGVACKNIIPPNELIFIPPATSLASKIPGIVNLQPPFKVQGYIDSGLKKQFDDLHKKAPFMSEDCHFALRKYLCGQFLNKNTIIKLGEVMKKTHPSNQNYANTADWVKYVNNSFFSSRMDTVRGGIFRALYNYPTYFPSKPHIDVCTDYADKCADFIASAKIDELVPNCTAPQWSSSPQLVMNIPLPMNFTYYLSGSGHLLKDLIPVLDFKTTPNKMELAVDKDASNVPYKTRCPGEFVVPDDPTNPLVAWVTGTGCAIPCKRNIWTPDEWNSLNSSAKVVPALGMICIIALLGMWVLDKNRRKQYLICCFAGTSFLATLFFCLMSGASDMSGSDAGHCVDNAVQITDEDGSNVCNAQAIIITYSALACCLAWLMQSIDLFLKICLEYKQPDTDKLFWFNIVVIFGLPLISVIILLAEGVYGYGGNLPWCFVSIKASDNFDIEIFYLPILVITILGVIAMTCVMTKIVMTLAKAQSSGSGSEKLLISLKVLKVPILFVSCFLIVWISLFSYRSQTYRLTEISRASLIVWIKCAFANWDGETDSSWTSVCGVHFKDRVSVNLAQWISVCATGQSILIAVIFLMNPSLNFPSDLHWFITTYIPFLGKYLPAQISTYSHMRTSGGVDKSQVSSSSNKSKVYIDSAEAEEGCQLEDMSDTSDTADETTTRSDSAAAAATTTANITTAVPLKTYSRGGSINEKPRDD